MSSKRLAIFVSILLCVLILIWAYFFRNTGTDFDAHALAASETRMWQAYYEKDTGALRKEMYTTLREQFGLSRFRTFMVSGRLTLAAGTFATSKGNKVKPSVLKNVEKAYTHVRDATGEDFDPREVAEAEVAWWAARRTPGKRSVEEVGGIIAELYATLYGRSNADIEYAGYLRAQAARVRDKTSNWVEVEQLLQQSYAYLLFGIQQ
jgi:hypothetical protein